MTQINWNLLDSPATAGDRTMAGFREGMAMGDAMRARKDRADVRAALGALRADPGNPEAMGVLFEHAPELAVKMEARADDMAFRSAARDWYLPGSAQGATAPTQNALASAAPGAAPQGSQAATVQPQNALAAVAGGSAPQPSQNALLALAGPTSSPAAQIGYLSSPAAPGVAGETPQPEPGAQPNEGAQRVQAVVQQFGKPQDDRDKAFLRMFARDPMQALKLQGQMRDNLVGQMEAEQKLYSVGLDLMARSNDEASWQTMRGQVIPLATQIGADVSAIIPDRYPGPEAVEALMERALPAKERLDLMLREANIEADNLRADRNTDSLIETREGRLDEYRRHNRASESNVRRGQDVRDRTSRRGQDIRAKGKGSKPPRVVKVKTVEEARALEPGTRFQTPDGRVMER